MSNLTQIELAKVRKAAFQSVKLFLEMKTTVVDAPLKELAQEIKKNLSKKNVVVEVVGLGIDGKKCCTSL